MHYNTIQYNKINSLQLKTIQDNTIQFNAIRVKFIIALQAFLMGLLKLCVMAACLAVKLTCGE